MDVNTLLAAHDLSNTRLVGSLDAIEKSEQPTAQVLAWRPGAGRAHIAWQAMHLAATRNKYLNSIFQNSLADKELIEGFGGGSVPSDQKVPTLAQIKQALAQQFEAFRSYVAGLSAADLERKIPGPGGTQRTVGATILMLAWHEAHHQGQIHLTWNLYKQAHNLL